MYNKPGGFTTRHAAVAALAAAALMMTGCTSSPTQPTTTPPSSGAAPSSAPTTAEPVTITYGIWDQRQQPAMEAIAAAFTAIHPNVTIKIELAPYSQYFTKLQTAASGGAAADVFWMNGPNFQLYASNGMLAPLDDAGVNKADYTDALTALYTYDGKLYGAPKDFDTIALWYNKALFDKAGVAYPKAGWTWADMKAAAKALTDPAKGQWGIAASPYGQENYYDSIAQAGGYVISADGKKSGYGSPEALAGIKLWTDLIAEGSSPTLQQMNDTAPETVFLSGKIAMFQAGSWAAKAYSTSDVAADLAVAPLPAGPAGSISVVHGLANVVFARSPHLDVAKAFAAFASSKTAADIMAASGTVIPAVNGTQQTWVEALPQYDLKVYIDALSNAVPYPVSKNTSAWATVEADIITKIWAGEVDPAAGLKDLATQMQALLDAE